jgi:hypothetical protein
VSDGMFGAPSVMGIDWKTLYGKLLAIFPYGREVTNTRFGESACVRADVYDLDAGLPVSMDALIFPKALVRQTGGVEPGKAVIGRLGQGEARGGQNAPWVLQDPTPEDFERARAYFAANPARAAIKYGGVSRTPVPQAQPYQPQPPQQPAAVPPPQPSAGPYATPGAPPVPPGGHPVPYNPSSYPTPPGPQGEPPY